MTLVGDGVRLAADDGIRLAAVQGNVDASCLEGSAAPKIERETNRHRFVRAATGAGLLAAVPYLYVLWGGRFDPYRVAVPGGYFSNFYDFQTRAFLRGELQIGLVH